MCERSIAAGWASATPDIDNIYQLIFEPPIDLELRLEIRSCAHEGMISNFYYDSFVYIQADKPEIHLLLAPDPAGVYVVRVRVVETTEPVDLHMSVETWF